jgi:hypothetical protein
MKKAAETSPPTDGQTNESLCSPYKRLQTYDLAGHSH